MEIIYSGSPVPNKGDRKVVNPYHFGKPEKGAKAVWLNGSHPHIELAYQNAGIPVGKLADMPETKPAPKKGKDNG